jgi:phosphatidylinositol dimannoside acyltransferase
VNRGEAIRRTYAIAGRALASMPEPVALGLAYRVADLLYLLRGDQRRMVTNNLRRVVGAEKSDTAVLDRWARRSFRTYARYWVEWARLPSMSPIEVEERTFVQGLEHLRDGMAAGRGVVLVLPHIGSWEFGGAFLATQDMPMTSVAERLEPPEVFDLFVEQRASMGLTIVPLDGASGKAMNRALREGKLVGLLNDRDLAGNGIEVQFFGETTTMPAGPATLALRSGAVLTTAAVYSGPGPDHHAVVDPPLDTSRHGTLREDVARLTQEIATRLEVLIRRAPDQWHVFQPVWLSDRPGRAA